MKWTGFLTMACAMFLMSGCARETKIVPSPEPLFCDLEEPRRFTQEELDWRAANAAWNLRRDFKTNAAWDRECTE